MEAVRRMQGGESASALARELEVKRSKLYDWCAAWERYGGQAFPGPGRRPAAAPRVEIGREAEANVAAHHEIVISMSRKGNPYAVALSTDCALSNPPPSGATI